MSCLWTRSTPILPTSQYFYNGQRHYALENAVKDNFGCSSDRFFANSAYTLSFGQLFSGDLYHYQSCNPICSCPISCSYERPVCCSNTVNKMCPMSTQSFPINPLINVKVNEAMKTIRKAAQKSCHYSIPSVPHCYNPMINENHITNAAGILEQAANTMSMATNRTKQF